MIFPPVCRQQVILTAILMSLQFSVRNVTSFVVQWQHQQQQKQPKQINFPSTVHHATILGWDDESDSYKSSFDDDKANTSFEILSEMDHGTIANHQLVYTSIADSLSHNTDKIASLARLAVAFSPPDQAVNLDDINHVHIVEVTNDHIELSAVVCDQSECITLLVPITFPHDCSSGDGEMSSTETCVLENIFELDQEAQQVLKQRDIQHKLFGGKNTYLEQELMAELHSSQHIDLPSWWVIPQTYEMAEECQQIKKILNQDAFQDALKALANDGLTYCGDDGDLFDIQRAVVSSLGPAGFYFRAIATQKDDENSNTIDDGSTERQLTVIDIPYSIFVQTAPQDDSSSDDDANREISDPSILRSTVLGIVASIAG